MQKLKNTSNGFTLIELMVSIAIIAIIALGSTSLSFNNISNKEKLNSFNNNIISNIESIRNNSLMGKGIGVDLINPKYWRIDFGKTGSGEMIVLYNTGGIDINFTENSVIFNNGYYIDSIICSDLFGQFSNTTSTGTLFISGNNITGSGTMLCDDSRTKKLEIITGYKSLTGSILINTVNGLIEKK